MNQTLEVTSLGGARGRRPGQPGAGDAAVRPARRPHRPGPRRRRRRGRLGRRRTASPGACASRLDPELLRYVVEQGLDRPGRRQPHRRRARRGLGRGLADPRDPGADEPRRGGGRDASSTSSATCVAKYVERLVSPFAGKERREPMTETQQTRRAGGETGESPFSTIEEAIEEIRRGRMVVVCDGEDRENEGDLVMAAQFATPEAVNFMAKEARGLICLALTAERCERLGLQADGGEERGAAADRLHGHDRGRRRGQHRDLRPRPRPHDPGRDRPRARARATSSSPATCSRCGPRRAACWSAPATPRPASTSPASPA